jgi:hypothetical protein
MPTPSTDITKKDGGTGVVRPSPRGVLAIVSGALAGSFAAQSFARRELVQAAYGHGKMAEQAAYVLPNTKKPIVTVRCDHTTDGAYSALTITGAGTSIITAGATEPVDEFNVVVLFTVAGTVGSAGIKYKYSINGGESFSKVLALGTANTITIPDTGVSLALAAGTILLDEKVEFSTTAPKITNADLPVALEALRVTSSPFEAVLVDMEADATTVGLVDLWLKDIATKGKFKTVVLTARRRDVAGDETEAEYKDALDAMFDAAASTDVLVCADVGDVVSPIRGITQPRETGLFVAARGMAIRLGVDPAFVELGPLPGVRITDVQNNPKYHNEELFPGLDDIRMTTLRTIEGFEGVYITNANLLSAASSDFVFWQHARTINRGCEIAYQILTKQLSRGVEKDPTPGPNGERYIREAEAQRLESLVNAELNRELVTPREVDDMVCIVSRTDDLRSNAGAEVTVEIQSVSLAYVKKFTVGVGFVTAIQPATPAT